MAASLEMLMDINELPPTSNLLLFFFFFRVFTAFLKGHL